MVCSNVSEFALHFFVQGAVVNDIGKSIAYKMLYEGWLLSFVLFNWMFVMQYLKASKVIPLVFGPQKPPNL